MYLFIIAGDVVLNNGSVVLNGLDDGGGVTINHGGLVIGEGKPLRHVIPPSIIHSNVCMDCTYYLDYLRTAIKVGHLFV